jgi:hypothetical protein
MMKKIPFVERKCVVKFGKRRFESDGAFIGKHKKTKMLGGVLYAYEKEGKVGNWKGTWKIPATFGDEWISNMGDKRQNVDFQIGRKKFHGTYFKSHGDIVRIRQLKGKPMKRLTAKRLAEIL